MRRVSENEKKKVVLVGFAMTNGLRAQIGLKPVPAFLALYKFFLNLPFGGSIGCMLDCHLSQVR
jgi:hypothetical protein